MSTENVGALSLVKESLVVNEAQDNTVWLRPADLLADNSAAQIVNAATIEAITGSFNTQEFNPPVVVRVLVDNPDGNPTVKLLIKDGMNRVNAIHALHTDLKLRRRVSYRAPGDHVDKNLPPSDFSSIPVLDATTTHFSRYGFSVEAHDDDGSPVLTMAQYWKLVVRPTVVHIEIADDRAAALILSGWQNLVGTDLSKRFNAVAALRLLSGKNAQSLNDEDFKQAIEQYGSLVEHETPEERQRLISALLHARALIAGVKVDAPKTTTAALKLLVAGIETGDAGRVKEQLLGLITSTQAEQKFRALYPKVAQREAARLELGELIWSQVLKQTDAMARGRLLRIIEVVMEQKELTYDQMIEIIVADDISSKHQEVVHRLNTKILEMAYGEVASLKQGEGIPDVVKLFIRGRLADRPEHQKLVVFDQVDSAVVARNIFTTYRNYRNAKDRVIKLVAQRDQFVFAGLKTDGLDQKITAIQSVLIEIESNALSDQGLSDALLDVRSEIKDLEDYTALQLKRAFIAKVVLDLFGDQDPSAKLVVAITDVILGLSDKANQSEEQIRAWLQKFLALDEDLQRSVLEERLQLKEASTRQQGRIEREQRQKETQVSESAPPSPSQEASIADVDSSISPSTDGNSAPKRSDRQQGRPQQSEPKRDAQTPVIEAPAESMTVSRVLALQRYLDTIDLNWGDLDETEAQALLGLVNRIIELRTGKHGVDVARIVDTYFEQVAASTRSLEGKIQKGMLEMEKGKK